MRTAKLEPYYFGLLAGILPIVTIYTCYVISLIENNIPFCNPYWIDCVSISRTGRYGAAYFVFKGGMITSALLFFLSWLLTRYWLLQIGSKSPNAAMVLLAFLGSLALILYTLALGHHGDSFELLRRGGVMFFIFATFMCQVLMAKQLLEIESMSHYGKTLLRFSAFMLAVGIVSLILEGTVNDFHDRLKNAIEWWVILWLNVHLLLTVVLWKKTGFSLDVTIR